MAFQAPEFGFMALAMAVTMFSGGIDLSIVSNATLAVILGGYLMLHLVASGMDSGIAVALSILLMLAVSTGLGFVNGIIIANTHIVPLLATLATLIFYKGIATAITTGSAVSGFPDIFPEIGQTSIMEVVPLSFLLFFVAAAVLTFVVRKTNFGKKLFLYGENHTVSLFSGLNTKAIIYKTYTLAGFLTGVGGVFMTMRVNSAKVGFGESYELQAILVCVLGGVSAAGGKGRIIGVVLGVIVLQLLQSGFNLIGLPQHFKNFIWGAVLIGVMVANYYIEKNRLKHN
ncbi:MAG: ABC transporter permease [Clostridiales Family XIII bacterium]|jgi:simple sugar transport system permease protein|nr:ABC transporter permease [Clostridiales Family XIII bacterium]